MNVKAEIYSALESNPTKYIDKISNNYNLYTITKAGAAKILDIIPERFPDLDWRFTVEPFPDNAGGALFICWIDPKELDIRCMSFIYKNNGGKNGKR